MRGKILFPTGFPCPVSTTYLLLRSGSHPTDLAAILWTLCASSSPLARIRMGGTISTQICVCHPSHSLEGRRPNIGTGSTKHCLGSLRFVFQAVPRLWGSLRVDIKRRPARSGLPKLDEQFPPLVRPKVHR